MTDTLQVCYSLGTIKFYPEEHILAKTTGKGESIERLEPKTSELLLHLIENRHRVVRQEEIFSSIWKNTAVTPSSLTVQINQLRSALKDSPKNPRFVKTIPKEGYRFIAEVVVLKLVLAILPFKFVGRLKDKELLEVGIAAALITKLSNSLKQLVVRPAESIFKYAQLDYNPIHVGREQQADFVLSGSLRKADDTIRASVRLIQVGTEETIWAETIQVQASKKFAIEDAITKKVINSLPLHLSRNEKQTVTKQDTENNSAYQHYLEGRYFWHKSTPDGVIKSIERFKRAANEDPSYALAYSGIAVASVLLGTFAHLAVPARKAMEQAEKAALKALDLDPDLAEALSAIASVNGLFRWDWSAAERDFQRAIEIAPELFTLRYWYGLCLSGRGESTEARKQLEEAVRIDPTSVVAHTLLARVLYEARQHEEAIAQCKKAIDLEYYFYLSHVFLGHTYRAQHNFTNALKEFEIACQLSNNAPAVLSEIGFTYGIMKKKNKALEILKRIEEISRGQYVEAYILAHIYLGLGDKDSFFKWLEKSYEERSAFLIFLTTDPVYDSVRTDSRFKEMVDRVGYAN